MIVAASISALFPTIIKSQTLSPSIIVNIRDHTLRHIDINGNLRVYPIVAPRSEVLYLYGDSHIYNIDRMDLKPAWKDSSGNIIPYGSSRNPLGAGRITFIDVDEGTRPCSIHGNANESDLGRNLSGCCIRMRDEDFLQLFWQIDKSHVIIIIK